MSGPTDNPFRGLPSVNDLVEAAARRSDAKIPRSVIVDLARVELDSCRRAMASDDVASLPGTDVLADRVASRIEHAATPPLAGVINATGIIVHTGLGRAPLADAAVDALDDVARHYAPVELDLEEGRRGRRTEVVRGLLVELTGAESATVVNNGAAALLLALAAVARDREVIVSRGELIEIGGSFRLPEIMEASGAILREVGTTNKTRASDYEQAIGERTAALLKVHTSNYRIEGFTASADTAELVAIARRHGLAVIDDIGSGALVDPRSLGLGGREPDARSAVAAGADLVLFSGDKLLGGPQAGIVLGTGPMIERLDRHPMMRALRVDKLTLAALGATLQLHRDPEQAARAVPVLAMATGPLEAVHGRAERLASLVESMPGIAGATVEASTAYLGGGSLPTEGIESVAVVVVPADGDEEGLATRLRLGRPPVVARVQADAVWLDLRTIFPKQDEPLASALRAASSP